MFCRSSLFATRCAVLFFVGSLSLSLATLQAADKAPPKEAGGPSWTQWRGPKRDGISTETGLLARWPEGGPPLVWKTGNLGRGFASVSIANGEMTPSLKIRRHAIRQRYGARIDGLYKD